jgi:hypothetical protein
MRLYDASAQINKPADATWAVLVDGGVTGLRRRAEGD